MLLYYFGSKEQLIGQALAVAAQRFPAFTAGMAALDDPRVPLVDRLLAAWQGIAAPENLPFLQLFFEVFGQAAHNPGRFDGFLARVGHDWTNQVAKALRTEGVAAAEAGALAREIVAVWRGRSSPSGAGCSSTCSPPGTRRLWRRATPVPPPRSRGAARRPLSADVRSASSAQPAS